MMILSLSLSLSVTFLAHSLPLFFRLDLGLMRATAKPRYPNEMFPPVNTSLVNIYIIYMLNIAEMIHRHVNVSSMLDSQVFIGRHAQGTEYTPHKYIQQCGQLMNMFYD